MSNLFYSPLGLIRRFWKNQNGVTAAMFAIALVPIIGLMGFGIDVGNALQVKRALQASTDAAVLAGALDITNGTGNPVATATSYSAGTGGKNSIQNLTVTATVTLKCFTSTGASCSGPSAANGLIVQQQTNVPTFFAKIFGINSIPVTVISTAGAAGAKPKPLNVMLVLDTTASMDTTKDPYCSIPNAYRITCALGGVQTLLGILAPSVDQVGLMVFPGLQANTVSNDTDCNANTKPTIVAYSANPTYQVVAPSSNYRSSDTSTSLSSGSTLVNAVGGGTGCSSGLTAVGGVGTFFADAIWQAQTALLATDKQGMQNVIVFLSDGDADSSQVLTKSCPANSSAWCTGNETTNQCHAGIKAAQAAAATGTWVFSIAYNAATSGSCVTDNPAISGCSTMQQIASDSGKFYSDSTGVKGACISSTNTLSDLVSIFQTIGQALQQPRLLPNGTS
jgi:Flp pilus assembly protein TadG